MDALKKLLAERMTGVQQVQDILARMRGWRTPGDILSNAKTLFDLVACLVVQVEFAAREVQGVLKGEDKQRALIEWLDAAIPLPFWLEWADGPILRFLVNLVVDQVNDRFGHTWVAPEASRMHRLGVEEITGKPYTEPDPAQAVIEAWRRGQEPPQAAIDGILGATPKKAMDLQAFSPPAMTASPRKRFDECLAVVLGFEGGYSNHPSDKGGATQFGITTGTLARARTDGVVQCRDVARLTLPEAAAIYRRYYWAPVGADILPPPLDLVVFDASVNCGVAAAVKHLQEALNALLPGTPLAVDGGFGPKTKQALADLLAINRSITQTYVGLEPNAILRYLTLDVLVNKLEQYDNIADKNESQRVFLRGWVHNRVVGLGAKANL